MKLYTKMRLTKFDNVVLNVILLVIAMSSLWIIDVSIAILLTSPSAVLSNYFMTINPLLGYHIGLYTLVGIILVYTLNALWGVYEK